MLFRLKVWLARRSKRLDKKFTEQFWERQHNATNKLIESIDLKADQITFTKK